MASIFVKCVVLLVLGLFVLYLLIAFLWKRKSDQDRRDYTAVLGEGRVTTFYNPEDYARAVEDRASQEQDTEE